MKIITRDIYRDWPEPMPMLLDSFAEYAYDPIPAIYIPAKITILQKMMLSVFRTVRDRGPNTNFTTASSTGGGKDDSSKEASVYVKKDLLKLTNPEQASDSCLLQAFTNFSVNASAQTQWLQPVGKQHEEYLGVAIIDVEAESHFMNIGQKGSGAASLARGIAESEIDCWNGKPSFIIPI